MNHLNEYKFFKGAKKSHTRYSLVPPNDKNPYYNYSYDQKPVKDPDEPFFIVNKDSYFNKKKAEISNQARELNKGIGIAKLKEYGFADEDLEKVKTLGEISNPSYSEYDDTYNFWVRLHNSNNYVSFKYYIPERDFVVSSPDYITGKKILKKRFDSATDAINWAIEIRDTAKQRRREMTRQIDERKRIT